MSPRSFLARRLLYMAAAGVMAAAVIAAPAIASAIASPPPTPARTPQATQHAPQVIQKHVCATQGALRAKGRASCFAVVDTDAQGNAISADPTPAAAANTGRARPYMAADLQAAYRLPSATNGAGQTIAIVDAFDTPNAEADLAQYRAANGLPPCTTANGCFRKVAQDGSTNYPKPRWDWALEASLDLDMASAACPNCHILLVEANDDYFDNIVVAVDEAAALGANVISNSYGANEYNTEIPDLAAHYNHPGVAILAATGDWGFGVAVPSAFNTVVAVGGTTLYHSNTERGWTETAWAGSGSGCSAYITKPEWQHDKLCGKRTVADVSAVADPNTPVAIYYTFGTYHGWFAIGGTSASSPLIAGVYALAGNTATMTEPPTAYPYHHRDSLNEVTSGSNGYCGGSYLCTAVEGYNGPTGLGTPNGIGAF